jgi:hypothetical protein
MPFYVGFYYGQPRFLIIMQSTSDSRKQYQRHLYRTRHQRGTQVTM